MKSKNTLCGIFIALALQLGMLAGSAQTNIYLFNGSETNITLAAGTYIITAYGAVGGSAAVSALGGLGARMSAEFNFSTSTTLTLLVGGGGGGGAGYSGGGGGGGGFVVEGSTPLVIAGGGGGGGGNQSASFRGGRASLGPDGIAGGFSSDGGGDGLGGTGGGGGLGGSGGGTFHLAGYSGGGGGGGFAGNGTYGVGWAACLGCGSGGGNPGIGFESGGGAPYGHGGPSSGGGFGGGGSGATSHFSGGGGGGGGYSGGGGGGDDNPSYYASGGGGGGSIIDSSAIAILAESIGISPDDPGNGEIIITAVPTPLLITTNTPVGFSNGVFGFNLIGPSGSNVVIQASADLQTWIPLQTNLLGSGLVYFSDSQSSTNSQRFYRAAYAFTVGGTLTGLPAGDTVTLQDNGSDILTLTANGPFTFPTALPNGHAYSVTVRGIFFGGLTPTTCTLTNGSGTISGANVTNVAVGVCLSCPAFTGNLGLDMYNAAVADGTDHGGVPGVMLTENGGPFRVTALGPCTHDMSLYYTGYQGGCVPAHTVGSNSCSSTTFPSGTPVIQFGTALTCQADDVYGY